jgi:predicted PolB exonuclease-like 3'-5' exonuclease
LIAHRESDYWTVDAVGAPHIGERSEKELIQAFVDKIAELTPRLVTFNGNSFDLPVLRYRAMTNSIAAPGLSARPYFNRYTDDAIDLCDVLSSFAPQAKGTLNELSRVMGCTVVKWHSIASTAESKKLRTIARRMSLTLTEFGCATNCFVGSSRRFSFS